MTEQQANLTATKERLDAEMKQVEQEASQMETFKAQAQERLTTVQAEQAVAAEQCPFCSSKARQTRTIGRIADSRNGHPSTATTTK